EMQPRDANVLVDLLCLGPEQRRMPLDRSAQTSVAPVHRAEALPLQGAPQRLEQYRVRSVPMHQDDGFACCAHPPLRPYICALILFEHDFADLWFCVESLGR